MKHLKSINENLKNYPTVIYTVLSDYTKDEQEILREDTDGSQNGYADLIELSDYGTGESDVADMLIKKGFKENDKVLIHYTW